MTRSFFTLPLLLLLPIGGRASSFTEEVGAVGTQQTATNPSSGSLSDHIGATWAASDAISLHLDLTGTVNFATKPRNGADFSGSGGTIFLGAIGLDWSPSDHWTLGGEIEGSPSSTQVSDAPVTYALANGSSAQADALVRSRSSSWGGTFSLEYETAGEGNFETAVGLSASGNHNDTTQTLSRLEGANGVSNIDLVRAACLRAPRANGCRELRSILLERPAQLNQLSLSASITETLFVNTDLGFGGTYSLYDQDPAAVGFFTIATLGRTRMHMGSGIQIAPYLYSLRPHLGHRIGAFMADLSYQYARYHAGAGYSNQLGLKLQYKFSKHWKSRPAACLGCITAGRARLQA